MKKYVCVIFIFFGGCLPKVTLPVDNNELLNKIETCNHEIAPLRFRRER